MYYSFCITAHVGAPQTLRRRAYIEEIINKSFSILNLNPFKPSCGGFGGRN
jgi:hypothetical protein